MKKSGTAGSVWRIALGVAVLAASGMGCDDDEGTVPAGDGAAGSSGGSLLDGGLIPDAAAGGSTPGSDGPPIATPDAGSDAVALMCTANARRCVDANTLETCSPGGNALRTFTCSNGCNAAAVPVDCQPIRLDIGWSVHQFDLTDDSIKTPAAYSFEQNGLVANQTNNPMASAYLNDQLFESIKVSGRFTVRTTADDDLVGFVFGWQDPQHFYLFDWKQTAQPDPTCGTAEAGALLKVASTDTPITLCADMWASAGTTKVKPISLITANPAGWLDNQVYDFTLEWRPGDIRITIKSGEVTVVTLTSNDATYTKGKFGFYNYSQEQVRYEFFQITPLP